MNDDLSQRRQERLEQAVAEYWEEIESGQPFNKARFLEAYRDITDLLHPILLMHERVSGFKAEVRSDHDIALPPGTRFGEFAIVRELGRGGMGTVYEAIQDSLNRRVALKIFSTTARLELHEQRRFKREAEIVAQLHHDHIVPVYSVGSAALEADQPSILFIAMRFIEGQSLARIIRALRVQSRIEDPDATNGEALAQAAQLARDEEGNGQGYYRAIATIGVQAASALAFAHAHGIFHRDIKPGNILVDLAGQAWVVDFGLAFASQAADATRTLTRVGTLPYLSPEQVSPTPPPFDERGDIYALGITLYESLTLHHPFSDDPGNLQARIMHERPPPLSTFRPTVPLDLERVIMKAMARDPLDRYQSATELGDDLQRFLDGSPVKARPLNGVQRVHRFAYRHRRRLSILGTAIAIGLIAGMGIGGIFLWRELRHSNETRNAELEAARDAVRDARDYRHKPGEERVELERLRVLLPLVERLAQTAPPNHDLHEELAYLTARLGEAEHRSGSREERERLFLLATARLANVVRVDPNRAKARMELAMFLGNIASEKGLRAGADPFEIMAEAENHINILLSSDSEKPQYRERRALLLHQKSRLFLDLDRVPEALAAETEALTICQGLKSQFPTDNPSSYMRLVWTWKYLAEIHGRRGEIDRVEMALREAVANDHKLAELFPKKPGDRESTIQASTMYAQFLIQSDRWADANNVLEPLAKALPDLVEEYSSVWAFRETLCEVLFDLAAMRYRAGDDQGAKQLLLEAAALFKKVKLDPARSTLTLKYHLCRPFTDLGDNDRIKDWLAAVPSTTPEESRRILHGLSALHQGQLDKAADFLTRPFTDPIGGLVAQYGYVIVLHRMNRHEQAQQQLAEATQKYRSPFRDMGTVHLMRLWAEREVNGPRP